MPQKKSKLDVKQVYLHLKKQQGRQKWWPADSVFEILVGAVLTQNTAWGNVEKAIQSLNDSNLLSPRAIMSCTSKNLANSIRSSGYFNVKAKRLRAISEWYVINGEFDAINKWSTNKLRCALLGVHGVGPETADDIILYVFKRPVFVIDAYTKRIFGRLGLTQKKSRLRDASWLFRK